MELVGRQGQKAFSVLKGAICATMLLLLWYPERATVLHKGEDLAPDISLPVPLTFKLAGKRGLSFCPSRALTSFLRLFFSMSAKSHPWINQGS